MKRTLLASGKHFSSSKSIHQPQQQQLVSFPIIIGRRALLTNISYSSFSTSKCSILLLNGSNTTTSHINYSTTTITTTTNSTAGTNNTSIIDVSSLTIGELHDYLLKDTQKTFNALNRGNSLLTILSNTLKLVEQNPKLIDNQFISKSFYVCRELTNQLKSMTIENEELSSTSSSNSVSASSVTASASTAATEKPLNTNRNTMIEELNIYLFKILILGNVSSSGALESQYKQLKRFRAASALDRVFKGKSNEIYIIKLYGEILSKRRCQFYSMGISLFREVLVNRPLSLYTIPIYEAIFKFMEKETMYDDIKPLLTKLQQSASGAGGGGDFSPTLQIYKSICANLYSNRTSKLIYAFFNLIKDTFDREELFNAYNWSHYTREMYAQAFALDVEALPTNLFENFKVLLSDTQQVEPLFFYNHPLVFKSIMNAVRVMDKSQMPQFFQIIFDAASNNKIQMNQVSIRLLLEFLNEDLNVFDSTVQSKIPQLGKYIDIFEVAHDLVNLGCDGDGSGGGGLTEVLEVQNCLLKYCLVKERFDRYETILHHIPQFNEETLVIMFNIYERTGNYVDANLLMRRAKTEEFEFTKEVVASYFKAMIAAKRDCLDEFIQFTQLYSFVRLGDDVFKLIYHELNSIKKGLNRETENRIKSILED